MAASSHLSRPVHDVRALYDLKVPMRDGIRLSADVFLPRGSGDWPTLLLRTPYESLRDLHIEWAVWWAKRGYAVVIQDCRGKFESEGIFTPTFPTALTGTTRLPGSPNRRGATARSERAAAPTAGSSNGSSRPIAART